MRDFALAFFALAFLFLSPTAPSAASPPPSPEPWFEKVLDTGAYNMGVMQDRDGFLWFTTTGGLIRYDGHKKFTFNEGPNGLTSNYATSVFEDRDGLLWIVTLSGLDLYNKEEGTIVHFQPNPEIPGSIASNVFNWAPKLITEDRDGKIWIGSREGLFRYDKKNNSFTQFTAQANDNNSLGANDIWTVFCDRTGKIWVGTSVGLDVFDPVTSAFTHFRHDPARKDSLGKGRVYAVMQDRDGDLWVGTSEGGLDLFLPEENAFRPYRHDPGNRSTIAKDEVFSITGDKSGNLWLGRTFSSNVGLERFNKRTGQFAVFTNQPNKKGSLSGDIILSCFEDSSGILWVPDNTGPINKVDPFSNRFTLHHQDPEVPGSEGLIGLTSVYEDSRGDIWLGGQNGLNRFDHRSRKWNTYPIEPGNPRAFWNKYIFSVIEGSDGNFWVATDDGYLNLFDRDKGVVLTRALNPFIAKTARQIIEDRANPNLFWFGVEGSGLFSFDKRSTTFRHFSSDLANPDGLGNEYMYSIIQDNNNIIWIQTQRGLHRFDPKTEKFQKYLHDPQNPRSISGNVVNDIFIDSRGIYWVSTDRGLNRFAPETGHFDHFDQQHGFTTQVIRAIEEDSQGNLWLGSNDGLFSFDPKSEKVIRQYTAADGLQSDSFSLYGGSALRSRDDTLWFVGLAGANSFNPKIISHNTTPPNVYLTNLSQGGEELVSPFKVGKTRELSLGWRQNFFEFEYVGLNYSQSTKNRYKYKLEGWDNDWFFAGNKRFGRYSGLSGGNYTLKIMAANNDGVWSTRPASLQVHVDTPFWTTWWFYAGGIVMLSGVAGLFTFVRIRQLQQFNKELETAALSISLAEKKYRSIFENAIEGIFQVSPQGRLISANPAAATIMGFESPEQLLQEMANVRDLVNNTNGKWQELLLRLRQENFISNYELQVRRKNGEPIWLAINVRVIRDDKDKMLYADGIMVDITVRKQGEEQLRQHQEHLEQLVQERTREYQEINTNLQREILVRERVEDELLRSRKLESIGVLAGGIAHDFNNLMTVVMGNINLAQRVPAMKGSKELENALHALHRAKDLTQKFITFSSGGEPIKKVHNIATVAQAAVDLALSGSNVQAKFTIAPEIWSVNIDESYISQAMYNILENSKNAMKDGGTVHIGITNLAKDRNSQFLDFPIKNSDYVVIEFQDAGGGIAPENLSKIFDPYFTTAEMGSQKGKGLGLTIAYSIIKKHGGYTFVESTLGKGTTVRVLLPAIPAESKKAEPETTAQRSHQKKKVLLMDDEEMLRDMAKLMLTNMGYEVTLAPDGDSAVTLFKQALVTGAPHDAVILDLTIPGGIGGKEVVKILGHLDPHLKAIVSSGYSDDPVVADFQKHGFVASLSKPYDMESLERLLAQVLGQEG